MRPAGPNGPLAAGLSREMTKKDFAKLGKDFRTFEEFVPRVGSGESRQTTSSNRPVQAKNPALFW